MKKLFIYTILALLLGTYITGITSCQELNIDSQTEGPVKITVDAQPEYNVLATSPRPLVFNISSNTPWKITSDKDWCVPSPASSDAGALLAEITVAIESNKTAEARTATLTISADGIENNRIIIIKQPSKEELQVIKYDETVPSEGATISFNIVSNKEWKIIPSTQFLENIDKTSGPGNENGIPEQISITIPANTGIRRTGEITVKTAFEEVTFTIVQDGYIIELEEPTEDGIIRFSGTIGEQILKIRSNTEWKAKVPDEYKNWITAEAIDNENLKISVKGNNIFMPRTGQVMLSTKALIPGFEDIPLEINQGIQYSLPNKYELNETDGSLKISGQGNNISSHYVFQKGHLTFEFSEIHLTSEVNSLLYFNMYTADDSANDNWGCNLLCHATENEPYWSPLFKVGGSILGWAPPVNKDPFPLNEINAIRKVELFSEDDPDNAGRTRLRLVIDGTEIGKFSNKPFYTAGFIAYLQFMKAVEEDYYIIKSITYEPYE